MNMWIIGAGSQAARHWFEQLERDIIHFLACHVHRGFFGEFLEAIQSKTLMVPSGRRFRCAMVSIFAQIFNLPSFRCLLLRSSS